MAVNKELRYNSDKHNRIRDAVLSRRDYSRREMRRFHNRWREAEEQVLAYIKETDKDQDRRQKRENEGKPQYTTIEVPMSYALLMTAWTYWSSVFLSRTPIFQYSGRHGESQNSVLAIESLINYQAHVGGNIVPLYNWLYDVGKYGLGVLGCYWDEQFQYVSKMEKEPKEYLGVPIPGTERKVKKTRRVKGYEGNRLFNVRPYDWYPDPRVPVKQFQSGEFCGRRTDVGWNTILAGKETRYFNVNVLRDKRARSAATAKMNRDEGHPQVEEPDVEGFAETVARDDLQTIELTEMFVELSPKDWELGDRDMPEKWLFTVADDEVIIEARPLGFDHNQFPFHALEYEPDAYELVSKGMLDMTRPLNDAMTWLFNQHFYNVRRSLNDQFVYDPSRIVTKDIASNEPGKLIRMKPTAYGGDIRTMIQQFPVEDITQSHITDATQVSEMMQRVTGITDNIMGQVNEGGRKTATEVRSSNTASLNRLKNNAEYFSAMGFEPLGQMMVQNTQQFYDEEQAFKIAGNNMRDAENFLTVTPQDILGFFDVVPVDGTLPVDRFAMANLFKEMIGDISNIPDAAKRFDIIAMYEHAMELSGVRNTEQFKVEVQEDEQLQRRAENGELTPLTGGGENGGVSEGPGNPEIAEREAGRPREPGQIPGLGSTG